MTCSHTLSHLSLTPPTGLRKSQSMTGGSRRPAPQHHLDPSGMEEEIPGSPTPMLPQQQHCDDNGDSDSNSNSNNYHSLQQQPKHCYIRRSFDRLPARGLGYPAGASARSSPSPSLKTFESGTHPRNTGKTSSFSNYNTIGGSGTGSGRSNIGSGSGSGGSSSNNGSSLQQHQAHLGARLTLSNNDVDGPFRVKRAQQNQTLLKTFSSPYSGSAPQHGLATPPGPDSTHPAWRRARGLETSWRPNLNLNDEDNDDNTTTSGSYIINPEELHGEENGTYNPDIMV
ncbi:hypothetical protein EGW08_019257 [Elysia chlorotica]|uniref:Uncharacterized protein n=1 Tax=Elysia chlorotica TaxID=188477 RepID=A0A3S1AV21_ELYCH|nr:hypothetical protein EGW08_019257 [Elysia chlorotica]